MMKILGSTVEVKVSSKESGGQYYVFEMAWPPGEGVPPHVHTLESEVLCILEGELEVSMDGEREICGPGAVKNFPVGTAHGFMNTGSEPCRAVVYTSPGANFERFFEALSQVPIGPDTDMGVVGEITERFGIQFV